MNLPLANSEESVDLDDPLVSVVVATNRGGPFLAEALESAINQSYRRIEIVLVDDGAEDRAALDAIVGRFPRVQVLRQANAGPSRARNRGVAQTSGELLVFLDDDDRWHPHRIASQVESLQRRPEMVVSYCAMQTIDANGEVLLPPDQRQVCDFHEVLRRKTGIILPNLMIRRDAFERVGGFHEAFRWAEDLDLILKLALEGPFVFVPQTGVDYRFHGANSTRRHHELCMSIDEVIRMHRQAALVADRSDLVADHDLSLQANRRFAAWSSSRRIRELFFAHKPLQACSEALWLARFAPTAPLDWVAGKRSKRSESRDG